LDGQEVEQVSSFTYLGFIFTPQLSFSSHLEMLNTKASSKCGLLLTKLASYDLPLHIILDLFNCYVLPTYTYGLSLWFGRTSEATMDAANSVFTKFLKRYLGIPYHTNNSITHFITNTEPLSFILHNIYPQSFTSLSFPACLNGIQLSQTANNPETYNPYNPLPKIPSYFWRSRYTGTLPTYAKSRRFLCQEIFDTLHNDMCINPTFHLISNECICMACGELMTHYHQYFCRFVNDE